MMGRCQICREQSATIKICNRCRKHVCGMHYNPDKEICSQCETGDTELLIPDSAKPIQVRPDMVKK